MSQPVITVEDLGKRYTLHHQARSGLLRDRLADLLRNPFRRTKNAGASDEDFWALRDVNFSVNQGDVVGIIGRNGAGKSTLLKILSRITEPTTGRIKIHGRVASLLEVGTGFHGELSGRENIFLNGAILGMKRAEIRQKFDEIVAFAEVEKFLDTPVKHYSSGMYVRLAFAVAAHLEPEILIIDEVLAVGDAAFQKKCLGKMHEVATSQGRTVLFVSHNTGAVRNLCQRVLWLETGRLRAAGPTVTMLDHYLQDTNDTRASVIDLTKGRNGTGQKIFLRTVRINDAKPVHHGEPFVIELDYSATAAVEEASFGCGFSTLDGTRLYSMDSDWNDQRPRISATQLGTVRAALPVLHLQPGVYALDVGARNGPFDGLDYVPACTHIEILPGPQTPSSIVRRDGGVRPPAAWSGLL